MRRAGPASAGKLLGGAGKTHALSGTGFSREGVRCNTAKLMAHTPASSRLKPVLVCSSHTHGDSLISGCFTKKMCSGGDRSVPKAGLEPDLVCREVPPPHCPPRRVSRSRKIGLRITRLQRHEVRGQGNQSHHYPVFLEMKAMAIHVGLDVGSRTTAMGWQQKGALSSAWRVGNCPSY